MREEFTVSILAKRLASDKNECFYCQRPIGELHKEDCVLINKKAIIKATIEYEIEIPAFWEKETVESHRTNTSWCSSNIIAELEELEKKNGCLCGLVKFECLKLGKDIYLDEN